MEGCRVNGCCGFGRIYFSDFDVFLGARVLGVGGNKEPFYTLHPDSPELPSDPAGIFEINDSGSMEFIFN